MLSIVTVTKDDLIGLRATLDSIDKVFRGFPKYSFEVVVVDGLTPNFNSSIFDSYGFSNIIFISERDSGIFDAMNKGIDLSSGEYLFFLNSGDLFHPHFDISTVFNLFLDGHTVISGNALLVHGRSTRVVNMSPWVCHQSSFIQRSMFSNFAFDSSLKYYGDLKFWSTHFRLNNFSPFRINHTVCLFYLGGVGNCPSHIFRRLRERLLISTFSIPDLLKSPIRILFAFIDFLIFKILGASCYYQWIISRASSPK